MALPQQILPPVMSASGTAHLGADGLRCPAAITGSPAVAQATAPGLASGHAAGGKWAPT